MDRAREMAAAEEERRRARRREEAAREITGCRNLESAIVVADQVKGEARAAVGVRRGR